MLSLLFKQLAIEVGIACSLTMIILLIGVTSVTILTWTVSCLVDYIIMPFFDFILGKKK